MDSILYLLFIVFNLLCWSAMVVAAVGLAIYHLRRRHDRRRDRETTGN